MVKDCDPNTGEPDSEEGYDDEYMLEDLEITVADQIQKTKKNNFQVAWDAADSEGKSGIDSVNRNIIIISPCSIHRMAASGGYFCTIRCEQSTGCCQYNYKNTWSRRSQSIRESG